MNSLKTTILLAGLTGLFLAIGYLMGGQQGMVLAFGLACVMNLGMFWFSDKMVLSMMRARPISEADAPELHRIVRELARRAGIPAPRIYITPDRALNAFATGRSPDHAAVAVTRGLLDELGRSEIEGVLAHEISHILNRDTLISTIAAILAGAISMLAEMGYWATIFRPGSEDDDQHNPLVAFLLLLVAPLAATLIQLAISRSREYEADISGARLTGNPDNLARALEKLHLAAQEVPIRHLNPAGAHLYIVNPLAAGRGHGLAGVLVELFSTHPPIEERIRRLRRMRWNRLAA